MPVTAIPASWMYTCDCCDKIARTAELIRPIQWIELKSFSAEYEVQGTARVAVNTERLLCDECGPFIMERIDDALIRRKDRLSSDGS